MANYYGGICFNRLEGSFLWLLGLLLLLMSNPDLLYKEGKVGGGFGFGFLTLWFERGVGTAFDAFDDPA